MKKSKFTININLIWEVSMMLVNLFVFFGYLLPQRSALLLITALVCFVIYLLLYKRISKEVINKNVIWFVILMFFFIQLLYTVGFDLSLKFIMTFGATLLMKMIYDLIDLNDPDFDWKKRFIKYSFIFSSLHVVATLMYNFVPDLVIQFNRSVLNSAALGYNLLQHYQGLNPGICDDYGFNAFCNLIFVGLFMSKILTSEKIKPLDVIILICGIIALIIIGKRGHLLCFAVGAVVCFFLAFNKMTLYKKILTVVGVLLLAGAVYYVALQIPATEILIKRLEQSQTASGMLNGRERIYAFEINQFKNHFLTGIGIRGLLSLGVGDGHNIYLQLLAETGIFCASLIFIAFISNLIKAFLGYFKNPNKKFNFLFAIFVQLFFLVNGITENTFFVESILIYYLIITSFCLEKNEIKGEEV